MTWSYSGDPSQSDKDAVRFLIQDTDENDQQMSDEEINWLLTENGSSRNTAVAACRVLAARYAGKVDKAVGDLRLSLSQKHQHYLALIKELKSGVTLTAVPYAGGISVADKTSYEDDSDRVNPAFRRDLHAYNEIGDDDD